MNWLKNIFKKDYSDWISFNINPASSYITRFATNDVNNIDIKIDSNLPLKTYLISSSVYERIKKSGELDLKLSHKFIMNMTRSISKTIYIPKELNYLLIINYNEEKAEVKLNLSVHSEIFC